MLEVIFILCALASAGSATLLIRSYRENPSRLLLWTALCFFGLAANNLVLLVDAVVLPQTDFSGTFWRNLISATSGSILLFGLIWEIS